MSCSPVKKLLSKIEPRLPPQDEKLASQVESAWFVASRGTRKGTGRATYKKPVARCLSSEPPFLSATTSTTQLTPTTLNPRFVPYRDDEEIEDSWDKSCDSDDFPVIPFIDDMDSSPTPTPPTPTPPTPTPPTPSPPTPTPTPPTSTDGANYLGCFIDKKDSGRVFGKVSTSQQMTTAVSHGVGTGVGCIFVGGGGGCGRGGGGCFAKKWARA